MVHEKAVGDGNGSQDVHRVLIVLASQHCCICEEHKRGKLPII